MPKYIKIVMIDQLISVIQVFQASLNDWWRVLQHSITALKLLIYDFSYSVIGKQQSEAMFGLVFGADNSLNSALADTFKVMGMLHIWSASGFNVSVFLTAVKLITYCSHRIKTILLLLSTCVFWWLSGQGPSMQRAVLMTGLSLLIRQYFFKQIKPLRSLLFTLTIIFLIDPSLINSLSLQFSVAATVGILQLNPGFTNLGDHLFSKKIATAKRGGNLVTQVYRLILKTLNYFYTNLALFFSVQIALLPLISSTWGELSWLSLITNTLLAGLVPLLVFLGLFWFGLSAVLLLSSHLVNLFFVTENIWLLKIAQVIGMGVNLPLEIFLEISQLVANFETSSVVISQLTSWQTGAWLVGWYFIGQLWQSSQTKKRLAPLAMTVFHQKQYQQSHNTYL